MTCSMSQVKNCLATIVLSLIGGLCSPVQGGVYVVQAYPSPVFVRPVIAPVPMGYPVVARPYYYPAVPVYSYQPVVHTYAPVVAAPVYLGGPTTVVQETTRVNRNRAAVRVKEYSPFSPLPVSNQVHIQRYTPTGVVIRHRGY